MKILKTPDIKPIKSIDLQVREARPSDIPYIASVHKKSFFESHTVFLSPQTLKKINIKMAVTRWKKRMTCGKFLIYVAVFKKEIIGVIDYKISGKSRDTIETLHLYIKPKYQRQKVGTILLTKTVIDIYHLGYRSVFGWVLKDNPKSRAFYESLGGMPSTIKTKRILSENVELVKYSLTLTKTLIMALHNKKVVP